MNTSHTLFTSSLLAIALAAASVWPALPAEPGQLKWAFDTGSRVDSSPALGADGTVYIGSSHPGSSVHAVDGQTGVQKWAFSTGNTVLSSPAMGADGTVYVGSADGNMYALDGASGARKWVVATGNAVMTSPAISVDGTVYVASNDGLLYALDGTTGAKKWTLALAVSLSSPVIGADGTVYIGSYDKKVYALNGTTGAQKWTFVAGDRIDESPAIGADGTVYVVSGSWGGWGWQVDALNGATGAQKWASATGPEVGSSASLGPDGTVYVGSGAKKLYAFDAATGAQKWAFLTGAKIQSTPAVAADGTVYFGSEDRKFYALEGASGVEKWAFDAGGCVYSSPTIGTDGTVYFGSENGKVYALHGSAGLANTPWPKFRHDAQNTGVAGGPADGPPVLITEPADGRFVEGATVALWVRATGSPPLSYQWFFQSAPLPQATNSLLSLPNFQPGNTGDYLVSVSNSLGVITSRTARLAIGFGLTVTNQGPGTVVVQPVLSAYEAGSVVQLLAVPNPGRRFIRWSGDLATTANPLSVTIQGPLSVVAEFGSLPGDVLWSFTTRGPCYSCPAIGTDGTVYFGSADRKVYAVEGATGAQKWAFVTGAEVQSSPAIGADGTVFVGSGDKKFYALDGATGVRKWAFTTGGTITSSAAVGPDGTVCVGSDDGKLYALDGATGEPRWTFATGGGIGRSSPAIGADGTVYVGVPNGKIYALDWVTGALRWASTGSPVESSPALGADGTVYIVSYYQVYALDAATGVQKWAFRTGSQLRSSPAIGTDGTIYVGEDMGDNGGIVHALDGATGDRKWFFRVSRGYNGPTSPAVGAGGTVYVCADLKLYALNGATGARKWNTTTGRIAGAPTVAPDGTVYVASVDNKLYAVQGTGGLANSSWPKPGHDTQNRGAAPMVGPPTILTEPVDTRVLEGAALTLNVRATGEWPVTYQWYFAGTPLAGATHPLLTLAQAQLADTGDYSVTVSNRLGVANSRLARLAVGFALQVTNKGQGSIEVNPAPTVYDPGTGVTLRAVPEGDRQFVRWSGDASGAANPLELTMDGHRSVVAEFSYVRGDVLWSFTAGGTVYSCPGVGLDGTVHVGSSDASLYALDGTTGARKWAFATGGRVYNSPAIGPDGTVYVGSSDASLYALDGATGARKWAVRIPDAGNPALGTDGTLYLGASGGKFYALDSATGTLKWVVDVQARSYGDSAVCAPAVGADGTVYATAERPFEPRDPGPFIGTLFALDGRTGAHKWSWVTPLTYQAYGPKNPVIGADGTVYCSWWDGTGSEGKLAKLSALEGATGVMKWTFAVDGLSVSPAAVDVDGTVYFGASQPGGPAPGSWVSVFYALDGATGALKWSTAGMGGTPAIAADGTVYVGSDDRRLVALDAATGGPRWQASVGVGGPPTIGADGTVYVCSDEGKLYALKGSAGLAESPWPKFRHDARNTGCRSFVPWVFRQPSRVVLKEGAAGKIAVDLDVAPAPRFRWFHNGIAIPGATQTTLTIPSVTRADEGLYTVVASNSLGQATSHPITAVVSNVDPLFFVGLRWESGNVGPVSLEATAQLGATTTWHSLSNYPSSATTQQYVEMNPGDAARFYRLNAPAALPFTTAGLLNGWWLTEPAGTRVRVEMTSAATGWTTWQELTTLTLPASPYLFLDLESLGAPERVYRTTVVP